MVNAVCVVLIFTEHKRRRWLEFQIFFFPSPTFRLLLSPGVQANSRSALSHGESDPVRFRWLIPFSALQVRLGNTAGKSRTPCSVIPSEPLAEDIC